MVNDTDFFKEAVSLKGDVESSLEKDLEVLRVGEAGLDVFLYSPNK